MTAESDVEAIAKGLTKAQREAFLRSNDANMHRDHEGRISCYGDINVAHDLHVLGLIRRATTFALATPLGLAVRAHLEAQPHDR